MTRRCELTGRSPTVGNNVSHANNKTRRRFLPNLRRARMLSESLGETTSFRVSANAIRTVEKRGGLDSFLLKARPTELSDRARRLRRRVARRQAADEA